MNTAGNSKMVARYFSRSTCSTVVTVFTFAVALSLGATLADVDRCLDSSGKYDLTPLSRFQWNVSQRLGPTVFEYRLRLCSPLQSPVNCVGSSVCRLSQFNDESASSLGSLRRGERLPKTEEAADGVGFWLKFAGTPCPATGNYRVLVNMQCGSGLGSPMLVGVYDCRIFFIWKTFAACPDSKEKDVDEAVPCYAYDSQGSRHDLSGLLRDKGGHFIPWENEPSTRFYVNVCGSIAPYPETMACPSGAAACRIHGTQVVGVERLTDGVRMTEDGKLQIVYDGDSTDARNCTRPSRTTITFACPNDGRSKIPVLVSDDDCDYKIEWETAEACPLKILRSSDACKLKSDIDGIDEDITPLHLENGMPHHAGGKIDGKMYDFYVSVCGGGFPSGFQCGDDNSSTSARVCRKTVDDPTGIIVGSTTNQSLLYVDDRIYLSYEGGHPCSAGNSSIRWAALIQMKCGSANGDSVLRFVQAEECVAFFEWETKYACVQRMIGSVCYVNDGGRVVDLSSLVKGQGEEPWLAIGDQSANKIFVNVCGPVGRANSTKDCPTGTSVCLADDDDGRMTDFGQYVNRPEVDYETGDIRITYTSQEYCTSSRDKFKSSVITFVCHPGGDTELGPRLISTSLDGCTMSFEWETAAACVQSRINGSGCQVEVPRMGFNFDLSVLRKKDGDHHHHHYNVTGAEYDYFLNVCGAIEKSPCSADGVGVCQVKHGDNSDYTNLGFASDVISYYNGHVKMIYENEAGNRETVISFVCDRDAGAGLPQFVNVVRNVHNFKWRTSHVCPPRSVQCVFINEATREQYDLSRLSRWNLMENWMVSDNNPKMTNRKFYINVCRSLTRADDNVKDFCDGRAAACATSLAGDSDAPLIRNLGRAESAPYFADGQLALGYTSGEPCRDINKPGVNYSAVIYFHCENSSLPIEEELGPMFLRNISCVYTFLWSTQAACPLQNKYVGNTCAISEPSTGHTFSFASLNADFNIPATGSDTFQNFYINICGKMDSPCGSIDIPSEFGSVAVCGHLKDKDSFVALASSKTRRSYITSVGTVKMEFDGLLNITAGRPDYRVEIVFLCHRELHSSRPRFVRRDDDLLIFEYESPLSCPPRDVDCFFSDRRGNSYDLKPLTGQAHYEIRDPRTGRRNIIYHLSVCRPLLIPPFSNCPEGVNIGACMSDFKSGIGYSLGYVQGRPRDGQMYGATVSLSYHSGSPCKNGTAQMSSRIDFKCSKLQAEPEFVGETADCEYIFNWQTPVACPLQEIIGSDCKVVDRRYSTEFDLSKLSRSVGYIVDGNGSKNLGRKFRINACGPLSTDCGGHRQVGVCVESDGGFKSNGGYSSDKLTYDHGEITLRYAGDGETSSLIQFICDHTTTGQAVGPTYLDASSTNSSYVFVWKTSYACRSFKESTCEVYDPKGNRLYDLGGLTLLDDNHEVIVNNGTYKFLINVCRSLVHAKDSMCHYGAAVCGVNLTEANNENKYANLGEVGDVGPTIDGGVLTIAYGMGEMCRSPASSGYHKTTKIRFTCDPIVEGVPYLMAEDGCQYEFGWSTAAACPSQTYGEPTSPRNECIAVNSKSGYKFDLNSLRQNSYAFNVSTSAEIALGICRDLESAQCGSNIGSCLESDDGAKISLGKANAELEYNAGTLVLNYTGGAQCLKDGQGSTMSTVIRFVCGQSGTGIGHPTFVEQLGCTYFVSWHTQLACETQVHCSVEMDNEVFDLSPLMELHSHHFAVGYSDDDSIYILNVCRPLSSLSGPWCPPEAAACRYNSNTGDTDSLGKLQNPPSVAVDGHIVIEYVNGSACSQDPSRNASTRIIFTCDNSLMPDVVRLIDVTENCTYVFEWPTSVVCPVVTHGLVSANCSYYDTRTRVNFDLARLHHLSPPGYQVTHDEISGATFTVNFCGSRNSAAKSGPCSSAAVCLQTNGVDTSSWGSFETAVYDYDGQHLRVSYKDGDLCPNSGSKRRASVIWFACDENAGPGVPELTKSFDCQVIFYWRTSLMCRRRTNSDCTLLHDGRQLYDLRLLSSFSHSWTIKGNSDTLEKFWLNICDQLKGDRDPRCPPASTVCWRTLLNNVVAIGLSDTQVLTYSENDKMLLLKTYVSADVCDRQDHGAISSLSSSIIQFVCSSNTVEPYLVSRGDKTNNCTFTFRWETPIACPQKNQIEVLESGGKIVDPNLDVVVDLSHVFHVRAVAREHRGDDNYNYHICLSGNWLPSKCRGAAICQTKDGDLSFSRVIGRIEDRRFYLQGPELLIKLTSESVCGRNPEKNASSLITMRCSPSAGRGMPVFVYETVDCNYIFDWKSDSICAIEAAHGGDDVKIIESSSSNALSIVVTVLLAATLAAVTVFIVLRKRQAFLSFFLKWCPSSLSESAWCSSYRQQPRHGSVSFARLADDSESANIIC